MFLSRHGRWTRRLADQLPQGAPERETAFQIDLATGSEHDRRTGAGDAGHHFDRLSSLLGAPEGSRSSVVGDVGSLRGRWRLADLVGGCNGPEMGPTAWSAQSPPLVLASASPHPELLAGVQSELKAPRPDRNRVCWLIVGEKTVDADVYLSGLDSRLRAQLRDDGLADLVGQAEQITDRHGGDTELDADGVRSDLADLDTVSGAPHCRRPPPPRRRRPAAVTRSTPSTRCAVSPAIKLTTHDVTVVAPRAAEVTTWRGDWTKRRTRAMTTRTRSAGTVTSWAAHLVTGAHKRRSSPNAA